jgi:hypothetical protein
MQIENKSFRLKGKEYTGTIAWPDDLAEALRLLGDREVWKAFRIGYLEVCRRQICGITPRRRNQKIDLSDLSEDDRELVLQAVSELRENYQRLQQAQRSAPLEPQPTAPSDYDETQAEAEAPASSHEQSFEEDFARYLDALDS